MGQAKNRQRPVGQCIYCGSTEELSDEHVVPFGLGGDLILRQSSCAECAKITSKLELKLLRGHWWAYRQFLGLKSRRPKKQTGNMNVAIEKLSGEKIPAEIPIVHNSIALIFECNPPAILQNKYNNNFPYAHRVYMKILSPLPKIVIVEGKCYTLDSSDKIAIPVNFEASDLFRFLAKLAHSYAISCRGIEFCSECFLPPFILGQLEGIMNYVGGITQTAQSILGSRIPKPGLHALFDRVNGEFLTVYIQLFRDGGDLPPIYEVVVGKIKR